MTDHPGYLQDRPLIEELKSAVSENLLNPGPNEEYAYCVMSVLDVLRRRGLITEQGLEIIKREME